jgi:uncharacterized protein
VTDATPRTDIRSAVVIAAGMVVASVCIAVGVAHIRSADRFVTVKGVAEQEVRADLAIWPIKIVAADNDLATAQAHLQANIRGVLQFLAAQQIDTSKVALQDFSVTDALANQYNNSRPANRYVIHQTVVIRSDHPDLVLAASQRVGELATAGVTLSSGGEGGNGSGPTFVFTGLNKLKPRMIGDATAEARVAAEQFAHDSHSAIGGIRTANQGVFEILPRNQLEGVNESGEIDKIVRVVSTVEYFLKD